MHLDTTTIVEALRSLSLRGTSGERAGAGGNFHRIGAANWKPLSPLLRRGERESTSGMVVVASCAQAEAAAWMLPRSAAFQAAGSRGFQGPAFLWDSTPEICC